MTRRTPPSLRQFIGYALPALPLAVVVFPSQAILPGFYAQHTQIPLATIGTILILARIFDAVVDPLIGFGSDTVIGRWGSRKPWLAVGALVLAIAITRLYAPAPDVGAGYYLGWFLVFYLGYSLIEIPYKAWGTELARSYVERSTIAACLAVAFGAGNLAFAVAPFMTSSDSHAYDAATLSAIGWAVAIVLPVAVAITIWRVPDGPPLEARRTDLKAVLGAVRYNRPLLHFVLLFTLTVLGQGIFYGLVFLYVGTVLGLGASFAWVLLADALVTLLGIPVWYALIRRFQKHRAWALGMLVSTAALLAMLALPDGQEALAPLIALVCLRAFGSGVTQVAPNALLGDVVDYELLKRHVNQAANFHAMVSLITKSAVTVGGGLGLLVVGLAGYDPAGTNPPAVTSAFKITALLVPAAILVLAAAAALCFPLHRRRHEIVLRRIERRARHDGF